MDWLYLVLNMKIYGKKANGILLATTDVSFTVCIEHGVIISQC